MSQPKFSLPVTPFTMKNSSSIPLALYFQTLCCNKLLWPHCSSPSAVHTQHQIYMDLFSISLMKRKRISLLSSMLFKYCIFDTRTLQRLVSLPGLGLNKSVCLLFQYLLWYFLYTVDTTNIFFFFKFGDMNGNIEPSMQQIIWLI